MEFLVVKLCAVVSQRRPLLTRPHLAITEGPYRLRILDLFVRKPGPQFGSHDVLLNELQSESAAITRRGMF
jgi:hypothetical protein